ncbi:MAG: amidohydrolase [Bacteroidaceae bacterium]|nr:amidohydrolase [Bacteroidaceae bacterium]
MKTETSTVAILQQDIAWLSPEINREKAERAILNCPDSKLYVLPEMFTTGFTVEPEAAAEQEDGETLCWMQGMAAKVGAAITGSICIRTTDGYRNRMLFVLPDGSTYHYDKRHLFGYAGENRQYQHGQQRVVAEHNGVRYLLQICYDLRFPVFSRNRGDYDAIIYVANWPESRAEAWRTLLKARAIENQCFVIGCNRVGSDPSCHYSGGSVIVGPYGRILSECTSSEQEACTMTLDMQRLVDFRQKFPVWKDADNYTLL